MERALDKHDQRLLQLMPKPVGVALRTQPENGLVRCEQGPGLYMALGGGALMTPNSVEPREHG